MRRIAKAAREGWAIPATRRRKIMERLTSTIANPQESDRRAIAAARAVGAMDRVNLWD
jgi:hypothetical protein